MPEVQLAVPDIQFRLVGQASSVDELPAIEAGAVGQMAVDQTSLFS